MKASIITSVVYPHYRSLFLSFLNVLLEISLIVRICHTGKINRKFTASEESVYISTFNVCSYLSRHVCSRHWGSRKRWRVGGWQCRGRWLWSCTSAGFYYCQLYLRGDKHMSHIQLMMEWRKLNTLISKCQNPEQSSSFSASTIWSIQYSQWNYSKRAYTTVFLSKYKNNKSNLFLFRAIHHFVRTVISFIQMMDNSFWNKTL